MKRLLLAPIVLVFLSGCALSADLVLFPKTPGVFVLLPKTPTAHDIQEQNATYHRYLGHFEKNINRY